MASRTEEQAFASGTVDAFSLPPLHEASFRGESARPCLFLAESFEGGREQQMERTRSTQGGSALARWVRAARARGKHEGARCDPRTQIVVPGLALVLPLPLPRSRPLLCSRAGSPTTPPLRFGRFSHQHTGDAASVRQLLRDAEDVDSLVDLKNSLGQWVVGVTPLYLAAQVRWGRRVLVSACVCLWGRERAGTGGRV